MHKFLQCQSEQEDDKISIINTKVIVALLWLDYPLSNCDYFTQIASEQVWRRMAIIREAVKAQTEENNKSNTQELKMIVAKSMFITVTMNIDWQSTVISPEIACVRLGYGKVRGGDGVLNKHSIKLAHTAYNLMHDSYTGTNIDFLRLAPFFHKGFGPDCISDFGVFTILPELLWFSDIFLISSFFYTIFLLIQCKYCCWKARHKLCMDVSEGSTKAPCV